MESDKRKWAASGEDDKTPQKKRVLGPSLPPPAQPSAEDSESDSDDDFGPSLPPPEGSSIDPGQNLKNRPSLSSPNHETKQPDTQRDQWMLHPPEQSDWATKIDPTQLRNRKFQTGKSARTTTSKQTDSSWVETPEERMRRLGDQVMGVGTSSNNSKERSSKSKPANSELMEDKIKKYNDRTGKSTRLEKPESEQTEAEDDPSARAFDREKDMGMSSKISSAQRRDMVNRASDYGSRFTKGEFL
ncbi:Protein of unknown function DUF3752 [Penicillium angulare]|uniref:Protein of unknown function DUF3752 n=1 Tax=Penicillium angulare TaxID=116970 RepID=UPI00254028F6|nr:Protein of unknown function DUF3752 [Penicillium angulare]KAJ5281954.1 Protein of unknown function DUF3752 [Penicillium angulare]